ncbi:hypothetical protein Q3G72_014732 [Acer saccharum]|nr:hypothetical protein Q3G72_014732 [Acer saccharum]
MYMGFTTHPTSMANQLISPTSTTTPPPLLNDPSVLSSWSHRAGVRGNWVHHGAHFFSHEVYLYMALLGFGSVAY